MSADPEFLEMKQAFVAETTELLAQMETALLHLETRPNDREEFNRLFRAVHTIKGSASMVGMEPPEEICHAIENVLVRIRDEDLLLSPSLVQLLLKCHDQINRMMERFDSSEDAVPLAFARAQESLFEQLMQWRGKPGDQCSELDLSVDEEQTPGPAAGDQRAISIDAAKLDQFSDLIVELVTASSVLESEIRRLGDVAVMESSDHVMTLIKKIQEKSMVFRMIPAQKLFQRFRRIVHDMGTTSGKEIHLVIKGGETELDKAVAEKLYEPLLHLVRNAIDHGIEPINDRMRAGKPPAGNINIEAFHESGRIVIKVCDDGQGVDLDAVASKAVELGLGNRDGLLTREDMINCIFEPGLTTLDTANLLSGRGVGMYAVRKAVESLRGRIDVETETGIGATFQISIPLSLSLVDGFMISLDETLYIVPMDIVLETLEYPENTQSGCLQVRGSLLPCLDLRQVIEITAPLPPRRYVVVVRYMTGQVGLIVDQLHGNMKTVIKPLGRLYRNVDFISGASILGDGSIALLFEIDKLIESAEKKACRLN